MDKLCRFLGIMGELEHRLGEASVYRVWQQCYIYTHTHIVYVGAYMGICVYIYANAYYHISIFSGCLGSRAL